MLVVAALCAWTCGVAPAAAERPSEAPLAGDAAGSKNLEQGAPETENTLDISLSLDHAGSINTKSDNLSDAAVSLDRGGGIGKSESSPARDNSGKTTKQSHESGRQLVNSKPESTNVTLVPPGVIDKATARLAEMKRSKVGARPLGSSLADRRLARGERGRRKRRDVSRNEELQYASLDGWSQKLHGDIAEAANELKPVMADGTRQAAKRSQAYGEALAGYRDGLTSFQKGVKFWRDTVKSYHAEEAQKLQNELDEGKVIMADD